MGGIISDEALREAIARESLEEYCRWMDPMSGDHEGYQSAAHTKLIVEHLEALERREIQKLMVFMPPRHGKSYHCSERFPSWYLGRHPRNQVIVACYNADLAETASRTIRDLMERGEYPFKGVADVRKDVRSVEMWMLSQGGILKASGVGGGITGRGAHLLIMDDLIKGRNEADSPTEREKVWRWFTDTANTRMMKNGLRLYVTTRWHEDDPAGRLLGGSDGPTWTVLKLRAEIESAQQAEDDPLGRRVGDVLWPEMYDKEFLYDIKRPMGVRGWEAEYQQNPVAEGGNLIQEGWWQYYIPAELPSLVRIEQMWDTAYDTDTRADYTVCATWGQAKNGACYLLDLWRERVDWPHLQAAAYRLNAKARADWGKQNILAVIENRGTGKTLVQSLRQPPAGMRRIPCIGWPEQDKSKWAREHAYLANAHKEVRLQGPPIEKIEGGMVYLPRNPKWHGATLDEFLAEHAAFPTGAHDDIVDTTIMALWRFTRNAGGGIHQQKYRWDTEIAR